MENVRKEQKNTPEMSAPAPPPLEKNPRVHVWLQPSSWQILDRKSLALEAVDKGLLEDPLWADFVESRNQWDASLNDPHRFFQLAKLGSSAWRQTVAKRLRFPKTTAAAALLLLLALPSSGPRSGPDAHA